MLAAKQGNVVNPVANEKVTELHDQKVYKQFQRFLDYKNADYKESLNGELGGTASTYQLAIKRFFNVIKLKDIEFLQVDELSTTYDDLEDFMKYLGGDTVNNLAIGKKLGAKTINKSVTAVKEFYRYLHGKEVFKKPHWVEGDLKTRLKENDNSYGALTVEECWDMAQFALNAKFKGVDKFHAVLFSLDTCIRKGAMLKLKWTDFLVREHDVLLKTTDKGNKDFRTIIDKSVFNKLKEDLDKGQEKVFNLSLDALQTLIEQYREFKQIPKERNIVFHSIRKAGAIFKYRVNGNDIVIAQKALNHSNLNTSMTYLKVGERGVFGAVSTQEGLDVELFKKVSHEDLLAAIDELGIEYKTKLAMILREKV